MVKLDKYGPHTAAAAAATTLVRRRIRHIYRALLLSKKITFQLSRTCSFYTEATWSDIMISSWNGGNTWLASWYGIYIDWHDWCSKIQTIYSKAFWFRNTYCLVRICMKLWEHENYLCRYQRQCKEMTDHKKNGFSTLQFLVPLSVWSVFVNLRWTCLVICLKRPKL